jgi:hypothetical protein
MSAFTRIIRPTSTARRAYSSFFSSKPGGGRYFNSAKPPKTVVNTGKSKADNVNVSHDGAVNGSGSAHNEGAGGSGKMKSTGEETTARPSPTVTNAAAARDRPLQASHNASANPAATGSLPSNTHSSTSNPDQYNFPRHPVMSPEDYKLHHFFSLHRPLLLHAQPTSAIFESPQPLHLFAPPLSEDDVPRRPAHLGTLEDPPEASPETDADAARQLARALVMNRVGSIISWEDTLLKLGLDGNTEEGRAELAKEWAREWDTIYTDSVKRKRKKKMKKHK